MAAENSTEATLDSIIDDFRRFEKASYSKYSDLYEQIRTDRKYIAGSQNDDTDDKLIGTDIPRVGLNVTRNAIRTIVNTYMPNQFKWHFEETQPANGISELNKRSTDFLVDPDNSTAAIEALTNSVGTALGVLIFSDDYDIDGSIKPVLYSISDVTNVRLDPNATKINFADSKKAAIVELKSKEWLKSQYGDLPFLFDRSYRPLIDISDDYDRSSYLPIVTYYVKDDEYSGVTCYKLLGDRLIEDPRVLPYSYIPVVPVVGEKTHTKDGKDSWTGITSQIRDIQRLVNFSYRQLILRCAKAPKNTWLVPEEGVRGGENGNAKYYQNSDKCLNPWLPYRSWDEFNKVQIPAPVRLPNEFQIEDISQLLQNSLGLMNSIIGIPATGLETDVEKTATEVLTNQKIFNNNVRSYIQNLKESMKIIGVLFADYHFQQPMYGKIKVTMIAGPDEEMKKQEARVQFQSFVPLLSTDEDRKKLLIAQCSVEEDNEYIQRFLGMLQPGQTAMEIQQQELLQRADNEIKTRDAQIAELNQRIQQMETDQKIQSYSMQREFLLSKQKHDQEMELEILKARLSDNNSVAEEAKSNAEIEKAELGVEKERISTQKEIVKFQNELNKETQAAQIEASSIEASSIAQMTEEA